MVSNSSNFHIFYELLAGGLRMAQGARGLMMLVVHLTSLTMCPSELHYYSLVRDVLLTVGIAPVFLTEHSVFEADLAK